MFISHSGRRRYICVCTQIELLSVCHVNVIVFDDDDDGSTEPNPAVNDDLIRRVRKTAPSHHTRRILALYKIRNARFSVGNTVKKSER